MTERSRGGARKRRSTPEELPHAEMEVLACLWNRGAATAAEIREELAPFRPLAHGSVLTLLKRLGEKGLVSRRKADRGKAFVFRPTPRPQTAHQRILSRLTRRVFGGNPVALVASLLASQTPSPAEIAEIRELLNSLDGGEGERKARDEPGH